jgi:pyruvate dehydrogenase E1 component beta subunit
LGGALGAALTGLTPVVEIMFCDFVGVALDQITNQMAKKAYLSGGKEHPGLVIRAVSGAGVSLAAQHSQSLEAWFAHTPGLISVIAGDPRNAKGLLKSAIRCGKPVMFFEQKALYSMEGPAPDEEELIPIGKCEIKRTGTDVTILGGGATVVTCLDSASRLEAEGISAEVIDVRTLVPLDSETIVSSVEKTGRFIIVEEDVGFCGWGAEVAAQIAEQAIYSLRAPVKRIAAPFAPIPYSPPLEKAYLPSSDKIVAAAKALAQQG